MYTQYTIHQKIRHSRNWFEKKTKKQIYIYIYSSGEGPQFGERCPEWLHVRSIVRSFFVQFSLVWDKFSVYLGSSSSILGTDGLRFGSLGV